MRHFVWATADGYLRGYSSALDDFPTECDPTDPDTTNQQAIDLRTRFLVTLGWNLTSVYTYDCPCAPGDATCMCGALCVRDCYISNGVILQKPSITMLVNNDPRPITQTPFDAPPGTSISMGLEGNVPDGHQLTLSRYGADVSQTDPVLTFSGGVTNTAILRSPAQGIVGGVGGGSKYVAAALLVLRGWSD